MIILAFITILAGIVHAVIIERMLRRCHPAASTARQHLPTPAWPKLFGASAGASESLTAACLAASCILAVPSLASADPVPASRKTNWSYTGVPGGIPNRTTICASFSSGATAAAINNAISSCNNGVVYLNAGTYSVASLGGTITIYKNNVTLRGAGADKTIIQSNGNNDAIDLGNGNTISLGTAITGGGIKGSSTFTVASTANLSVGQMIEIDRTDDPTYTAPPSPHYSFQNTQGRQLTQLNVITAISGNTITVRNPLVGEFSTGSPRIKLYYTNTKLSGVEDLKLDYSSETAGARNFSIINCDSCWVKGIDSYKALGSHTFAVATVNLEIRDSVFRHGGTGPGHSGPSAYGDYKYGGNSSWKIENNILADTYPLLEFIGSNSGHYIGYNYAPGSNGSGNSMVFWSLDNGHGPLPFMNLYEGNITDNWGTDGYFGGSAYATALRNWISGYNWNKSGGGDAVWLRRFAYFYTIIGNVLGSTQQAPVSYAGCGMWGTKFSIYSLGYPNTGNCDVTPFDGHYANIPGGAYPDQKVATTLLRWGNYDYFNKATRFAASEVPAGVPVPGDQIIPNSYAYNARPSWWPPAIPWPPIGPDVTGGNGDTSGHVNKIPAQVCWETSNLKGGGSFNSTACYAAQAQAKPAITSSLTASGTAGTPFNYAITATNNPASYNATGLPTGLSVNTATGVISGTPAAAGTSSVTLSATNATGTGTATLTLTISALSAPVITSPSAASGKVASPFSYTIKATNNPTSFYAAVLPPGVSVNTASGVISGTPSAVGVSSITQSATNAAGTGTAPLTLTITNTAVAPAITSALTASGTIGSPFSYTITASNGPASFNATGLPAGLSVNTTNGAISGTPTAAGTFSVKVSASNSAGTGSATLALTINSVSSMSESLFSGISSPPIAVQNDPSPVELGVKFYATRLGKVTGVRFYKNPRDAGPHIAHLWASNGKLLASATFTSETASGWQQVNFPSPVPITANITYVASYHSNGNYGETDYFFKNAYTKGSLVAPSSAASGGNSVYAYDWQGSFPSNSWNACNYWVDVVFQ